MPNIHHALAIWAPIETVYEALTTEKGLSAWWTPGVTTSGTLGSVARFPFGARYFKEMRITDLQPPKQVQWHCVAGADEWIGTEISFNMVGGNRTTLLRSNPEAAGQLGDHAAGDLCTLLSFRHNNWQSDTAMFAECSYTWGQFLRSLKLLCETGMTRSSPNVHDAATP